MTAGLPVLKKPAVTDRRNSWTTNDPANPYILDADDRTASGPLRCKSNNPMGWYRGNHGDCVRGNRPLLWILPARGFTPGDCRYTRSRRIAGHPLAYPLRNRCRHHWRSDRLLYRAAGRPGPGTSVREVPRSSGAGPQLLRKVWKQNDSPRAVCSYCSDVRSRRCGSRGNELSTVCDVQHSGRYLVGIGHKLAWLRTWTNDPTDRPLSASGDCGRCLSLDSAVYH